MKEQDLIVGNNYTVTYSPKHVYNLILQEKNDKNLVFYNDPNDVKIILAYIGEMEGNLNRIALIQPR